MATTISGTAGVTFPAGGVGNPAGAVVGTTDTQTLTNKTLSTGLVMGVSAITSGTAQTAPPTTPQYFDFTSIPSWVKRITVMFNGVSTSGTSIKQIQLGDSGGFEITGYLGSSVQLTDASSVNAGTFASGFGIRSAIAADVINGAVVITNITANTWVAQGTLTDSSRAAGYLVGGAKPLSDVLTQVRITTVNGTDTFDAGSINILYE